jgi:hypothetical protein
MIRTLTEFNGAGVYQVRGRGWFASHRHGTDGANKPYTYSYLFGKVFVARTMLRTVHVRQLRKPLFRRHRRLFVDQLFPLLPNSATFLI